MNKRQLIDLMNKQQDNNRLEIEKLEDKVSILAIQNYRINVLKSYLNNDLGMLDSHLERDLKRFNSGNFNNLKISEVEYREFKSYYINNEVKMRYGFFFCYTFFVMDEELLFTEDFNAADNLIKQNYIE